MVSFVEIGVQLLSASTLDSKALAHFDIESWAHAPRGHIQDWVNEDNNGQKSRSFIYTEHNSEETGLIVPPRLSSAKVHVMCCVHYEPENFHDCHSFFVDSGISPYVA